MSTKDHLEIDDVQLDGYRRVSILQQGANSEIWEVAEPGTDRRLVLKLLRPGQETNPANVRALRHEAQVAKEIEHANVIRVHAFVKRANRPYLVMELFRSQSLKLRMMQGQFDSFLKPRAARVLKQTAVALAHMHSKGWLHRDVKPDNVLVSSTGDVKLIDFAIAVRASRGWLSWLRKPTKTAGTRSYMSPEQLQGLALDRRADVYSFGVLAYELVAGRLPFTAGSQQELMRKHLVSPVPAIDAERNVSPAFEDLLQKMLAKKPEDRLPSMDDFVESLRHIKIFEEEGAAGINA